MADKLYKFSITYKDKRTGGIASVHNIQARNIYEAKNVFKSRYPLHLSIISCVRGESCQAAQARAEEAGKTALGNLFGGLVLAAGAAVVATVMNNKSKS